MRPKRQPCEPPNRLRLNVSVSRVFRMVWRSISKLAGGGVVLGQPSRWAPARWRGARGSQNGASGRSRVRLAAERPNPPRLGEAPTCSAGSQEALGFFFTGFIYKIILLMTLQLVRLPSNLLASLRPARGEGVGNVSSICQLGFVLL